jgi:hypothetical protein
MTETTEDRVFCVPRAFADFVRCNFFSASPC